MYVCMYDIEMNMFGVKLLIWEVHLPSSNLKHRYRHKNVKETKRQDLMGGRKENRKQFVDAQPYKFQ